MFRDGLLNGARVVLAGAPRTALAERLEALGARLGGDGGPPDALVVDAPDPGGDLVAWSGAVWESVRAVAAAAWTEPGTPGGRVVLVAPPASEPACAALENLARTLSIEWSRFGIRPTCVAPGPRVEDGEVADAVAYLLSPAGAYFSGCRLDLA